MYTYYNTSTYHRKILLICLITLIVRCISHTLTNNLTQFQNPDNEGGVVVLDMVELGEGTGSMANQDVPILFSEICI